MPMPTRLERWMRSKLSAMTARTPRSFGPLAAQSREEPKLLGVRAVIAEKLWSLGCPIARGAGAVFLACEDHERHAALCVLHAGVKDGHSFALGQQARDAAFGAGRELVAQAHIGESAADHDFMIAAARAVAVEVRRLDTVIG